MNLRFGSSCNAATTESSTYWTAATYTQLPAPLPPLDSHTVVGFDIDKCENNIVNPPTNIYM
jgi:hypothetical protein